jgi:hypothetical protein
VTTPILPNAFPTPQAQPSPADAARSAAQRAFFDAAMGRSAAPAQTQAPAATAAPQAAIFRPATMPVQRAEIRPALDAEPPAKILRPGSLLDIRV